MPRPSAIARRPGTPAPTGALHQGCILAVPRISGHGELLAKGQERTARLELCSSRGRGGGGDGFPCDAKTEPQRGFHSGRGNSAKAASLRA